jgi:dephospho-CoA kinase
MKWIGLTGGIAAGKSTVSKFLPTLGHVVLDADEISHQLTNVQGVALPAIFRTFGEAVKNPDGSLDRKALGALVFGRVQEMKKLEAILHPLVQEKIAAEKSRHQQAGTSAVFYDVPLLYEKNLETEFDQVVLVYCEPAQQLERLMSRNQLSDDEARKRIASQLPLEDKKSRTPYVIHNTRDLVFLESEIRRVLAALKL